MKRIVSLFSLLFVLTVSATFKKEKEPTLTGMWRETWYDSTGSGVDFNDIYQVIHKKDKITMSCSDKAYYSFDHIHLTGMNFTFQLTNNSDPEDIYIMAYNLEVSPTWSQMKGTAVTNKGVEASIILDRIGRER